MNDLDAMLYMQSNVSRETFLNLQIYHKTLLKWNRAINLIGPQTENSVWSRHILDCYQIGRFIQSDFADLGSGAGLPGVVCGLTVPFKPTLVESDLRKASFLRNVSRETNLDCVIETTRVETLTTKYQTIMSRALCPVAKMLSLSQAILLENSTVLLLKGANVDVEIEDARLGWDFQIEKHPSITSSASYIIVITKIRKKS